MTIIWPWAFRHTFASAVGYAAIANGGYDPDALVDRSQAERHRVLSDDTAAASRKCAQCCHKDSSMGDVPGYAVAGKLERQTSRAGSYETDKVIATFASIFPAYDPKYVWWLPWTSQKIAQATGLADCLDGRQLLSVPSIRRIAPLWASFHSLKTNPAVV